MKTILGLDLGTNSIGWALVKQDFENKNGEIIGMGSRIIPMSQDILGEFGKGNSISQTAERTKFRGTRRLKERFLLRRERLHRVLNLLNFLPIHYKEQIDFSKKLGKFINNAEPKIAYNNDFLFKKSFFEMIEDFKKIQPNFLKNKHGEDCLVPYDWTIYYLRKKALTEKIDKEELAWLILNFNQKRGYYQLRGEEVDDDNSKLVEFHSLKITDVIADKEKNKKGETWYNIYLENGWIYRRSSKISLEDWKGKTRDFIVTTEFNDDGTIKCDKEGKEKRSFRAPNPDDWTLLKKKTEFEIETSDKSVGEFIYDHLLRDPKQKIKGKLVRTIERKFYKKELEQILTTQSKFHPELKSKELLNKCSKELYKVNEEHRHLLESKDFTHLFLNDIIFYQRPLKSKKNEISNCSLEHRFTPTGEVKPLKVIAKSNPYFQEFRLLQWIKNLSIYPKDSENNNYIDLNPTEVELFKVLDFCNSKKEIKQEQLIDFLLKLKNGGKKISKIEVAKYRWNYVEDKVYPGNETRHLLISRLNKVEDISPSFLTFDKELELWHIIYSVNDKIEFEKAIKSFASKNKLNEQSFFEAFKNCPPLKAEYGSFSEKAIKKLLPLMRFGNNWNWNNINPKIQTRIQNILNGEFEESIHTRVREKTIHLNKEDDFSNLPLWLAQYVVYNRHSEASIAGKWNSVDDLNDYIKHFKQHSLRNPIVEQIVSETLRVVRDIWKEYGKGTKDFFSEIHIELGRELKNTADERKRLTNVVTENENTNLRIKAFLAELSLNSDVENVRPYSPIQQELLKIYEDGALNSVDLVDEDILKISKMAQPSSSDFKRYKLWLEQNYRSPYTGKNIPLNKLFTPYYEIEHIIPQSRYFDDSFNNKVICEAEVNSLKSNLTAFEFIKKFHGYKVSNTIEILETDAYENLIKKMYSKNKAKRDKLLMEDIPEAMINRQLNDTRYISKFIMELLSNIVRSQETAKKDDGVNSINIIPVNGKITSRLKQDWGLNDVWNEIILPRFERMNEITQSKNFTSWNENHQKYLPTVPIELSKGFSKKRIDHRHHAMDALVIACATRNHVNLLNNESAKSDTKRADLNKKLRTFVTAEYIDDATQKLVKRDIPKDFYKPWHTFTQDAHAVLDNIIVSFKQNTRVINKATNYYESYTDENGNIRLDINGKPKKGINIQKGTNWAVRKSLHKDTVSGKVRLDRIKVAKDKILTATRKPLDTSFNLQSIKSITDTGIQKILENYLLAKDNNPEIAFSPEGIEELNKNIQLYNDGKRHQPILKVRVFEQGSKFPVGVVGNKSHKYVEAAKGTNLFFGIYIDSNGKRSYETIPLNIVVERQKQGLSSVPEVNEKGHSLLFSLSPNDLVYLSNEENHSNKFIYKVVSFTGNRLSVLPINVSNVIYNKVEFTQLNKIEFTKEKEIITKIKLSRLGKTHYDIT